MPTIALKAHFDGRHILLDEACNLPVDTPLLVTVLPKESEEGDMAHWLSISSKNLARAYSDDEPEYTMADIK